MLLCFQIRVNFTLVLCIACYHFEFGIAAIAVAFGLGGKDIASQQLREWLDSFKRND
jgi:hypothetical protein